MDRFGELGGAAVGEIVARHRGDDDVAQSHSLRGVGDAARLVGRRRCVWTSRGHVAEAARARADIAEDHERGGLAREAFRAIGTRQRFADGVEIARAQQRLHLMELLEVEALLADPAWKAGGHRIEITTKEKVRTFPGGASNRCVWLSGRATCRSTSRSASPPRAPGFPSRSRLPTRSGTSPGRTSSFRGTTGSSC